MNSEQMPRCSPQQSAVYYRSFIGEVFVKFRLKRRHLPFQIAFLDLNQTSIDRISTVQISDPNLQGRLGKECLQDCVQDRYSLSQSFSDFSDNLKADLVSKINAAGAPTSTTNIVILKFYLNSLEFNKIHNFPQHGLQFVAEVSIVISCFSMHFSTFPTHDFEKKSIIQILTTQRYSHMDFLCNRKFRILLKSYLAFHDE